MCIRDRSEGIKDANGKYVSATTAVEDTFGHSQLSGTGKCLEYIIKQNIQVKAVSYTHLTWTYHR